MTSLRKSSRRLSSPPPPQFLIRIRNDNTSSSSQKDTSDLCSVAEESVITTLTSDDMSVCTTSREGYELKRGLALCRDVKAFEKLESNLHREMTGVFVPKLEKEWRRMDGEDMAEHLGEYLDKLIEIPDVVRSEALLKFLTTEESKSGDDESKKEDGGEEGSNVKDDKTTTKDENDKGSNDNNSDEQKKSSKGDNNNNNSDQSFTAPFSNPSHIDYLLPENLNAGFGDDDAEKIRSVVTVPRKGTFTRSETVPHGWWVVWQCRLLPSSSELDYTIKCDSVVPDPVPKTVIHNEVLSLPNDDGAVSSGSYRHLPDETRFARCTFTFANNSLFRGAKVDFAVKVVSHKVFKAACTAASDQAAANARRFGAPLLGRILDSSHRDMAKMEVLVYEKAKKSITLVENEEEKKQDGSNTSERKGCMHCRKYKKKLNRAEKTLQYTKDELNQSKKTAQQSIWKLQMAQSEKRVWEVSKKEVQEEVQRMREELKEERETRKEKEEQLEILQTEEAVLRGEVMALRMQVVKEEQLVRTNEELQSTKHELTEAKNIIGLLNQTVKELHEQNKMLEDDLEVKKRESHDALLDARADADQARMMQKILEKELKELKMKEAKNNEIMQAKELNKSKESDKETSENKQKNVQEENKDKKKDDEKTTDDTTSVTQKSQVSVASSLSQSSPNPPAQQPLSQRTNEFLKKAFLQNSFTSPKSPLESPSETSSQNTPSLDKPKSASLSSNNPPKESLMNVDTSYFVSLRFDHPDKKINEQLVGLRDRHAKLTQLLKENPSDTKKVILVNKIEGAIKNIVVSGGGLFGLGI